VKFVKRFLNFFVENHVEKMLTLEVTVIVVVGEKEIKGS
jgi:hypothetical protein